MYVHIVSPCVFSTEQYVVARVDAANDAYASLMIMKKIQSVGLQQELDPEQKCAAFSIDLKEEFDSGKLERVKSATSAPKAGHVEIINQTVTSAVTMGKDGESETAVASIREVGTILDADNEDEAMDLQPEITEEEQRDLQAYKLWYAGQSSIYQMCVVLNRTKVGAM